MKWVRYRFLANFEDSRPVLWPPPGPWWESGQTDDRSVVVAFLPAGEDLCRFWPEAESVDSEPREELTFTGRFSKPAWWAEIESGDGR